MTLKVELTDLDKVEPFMRQVDKEGDAFTNSLRTWHKDSWQKIMERIEDLGSSVLTLNPESTCLYMCAYETGIEYLKVHRSRDRAQELWRKVSRVLDKVPEVADQEDVAGLSDHERTSLRIAMIAYEDLSRRLFKHYPGLSK